jgi:hypothetical protein
VLGLVQDEPNDKDRVEEVNGLRFLLDGTLAGHLERFFPLTVDFDDRYWTGIRVRPFRGGGCC